MNLNWCTAAWQECREHLLQTPGHSFTKSLQKWVQHQLAVKPNVYDPLESGSGWLSSRVDDDIGGFWRWNNPKRDSMGLSVFSVSSVFVWLSPDQMITWMTSASGWPTVNQCFSNFSFNWFFILNHGNISTSIPVTKPPKILDLLKKKMQLFFLLLRLFLCPHYFVLSCHGARTFFHTDPAAPAGALLFVYWNGLVPFLALAVAWWAKRLGAIHPLIYGNI